MKDRKARQEKLHAEAALRISEEQMRGILSTVEDMVFSMSLPDYKLRYMNPAGAKLFGRPVEDFMADPTLWLESIHPEDRQAVIDDQLSAIKWGTRENRFRMVTAKGSIRHVTSRVWVAYDAEGKPSRLEGIVSDVTERLQAEQEKGQLEHSRLAQERLERINEFKSQFLNMVAHDLNNIVTPMRLSLRTIQNFASPGLDETLAKPVETLGRSVERMTAFLADLLDAARMQAGQLKVARVRMDLSAALLAAVEGVSDEGRLRNIDLQAAIPPGVQADADARRIEQVTTNLLGNALKFTPAGGTIQVQLTSSKGEVEVGIVDSGPGIKAEDQPKLFQPFSQVGSKNQGKHTGTGLGLFICKGIIEAHGGRIWCESKGGQGARFSFTLPRSQPPGLPDLQRNAP
ncbi:MAG: PAS domain-containing sensor histidine kinase [Thermoplasmatota archaeon]